jgi:hypothetical protein
MTLGFGICPSFKDHSLSPRAKPLGDDSQLLHRYEEAVVVTDIGLSIACSNPALQRPGRYLKKLPQERCSLGEGTRCTARG